MKEPKLSNDGNCPACSGVDWKLAKVLVLAGVTNIDTESDGGGFGVGVGGRGVNVNYQGLDLSTTGTHTTGTAAEYAAPKAPDQYDKKDHWLKECSNVLKQAAGGGVKIDQFAATTEKITPGLFSISDTNGYLESCEKYYKECCDHLIAFQAYEREKALWDRTRVCQRCGESFVTNEDRQSSKASFDVPELLFEGKHRRCPKCNSYQWKTAEVFFSIKTRQLEEKLKVDMERLQEALDYASNPSDGGFWKKLGRKLLTLKPEDAKRNVEQTQVKLSATIEARDQTIQHHPDFQNTRVCSACEASYTLADVATCSTAQPEK